MTARYLARGRSDGDDSARPLIVNGNSNCTPHGLIGSAETADARVTPGIVPTRVTRSSKNCFLLADGAYLDAGNTTWAATRPDVRYPGSSEVSWTKLRISRPAPTNSTSASATSATTITFDSRRAVRLDEALREEWTFFVRGKNPSMQGRHAQHREQQRGHIHGRQTLGLGVCL